MDRCPNFVSPTNSLHFLGMTGRDSCDAAARARVSDPWADASVLWNQAMTEALLSLAAINPECAVLDLAAGSGEPALTIAPRLSTGKVIALDSSHASLSLALNCPATGRALDSLIVGKPYLIRSQPDKLRIAR